MRPCELQVRRFGPPAKPPGHLKFEGAMRIKIEGAMRIFAGIGLGAVTGVLLGMILLAIACVVSHFNGGPGFDSWVHAALSGAFFFGLIFAPLTSAGGAVLGGLIAALTSYKANRA